jgi:hypothetical protein
MLPFPFDTGKRPKAPGVILFMTLSLQLHTFGESNATVARQIDIGLLLERS